MRALKVIALLTAGAVLLGGCATTSQQPRATAAPTPSAKPSQPIESPSLPEHQLSGALLYGLLGAELASQRGHYTESARQYLELAMETDDPRLAERATRNAMFAHDDQLALSAAEVWVELAPADLQGHQFAAMLYIRTGEMDKAVPELQQVLRLSPSDNGFMSIATLMGREMDKTTALKVMGTFIQDYQDNPDALHAHSYMAYRAGDFEVALDAIDRALMVKHDWPKAMVFRARILVGSGKTEQALEYLQGRVEAFPTNKELRINYAQMLMNAKRLEQAYTQYQEINKQIPDNTDVLFTLGIIAIQLNYIDDGEQYLLHAKELSGHSDELSYFLGQVAELKKEYQRAIDYYSDISRGQYYFDAKIHKATLVAKLGDISAARGHLHNLRVLLPQRRVDIYLAEGDILRDAEMYQEAMNVYNNGLAEFPNNSDLLYARSYVADRLGRVDVAERDLLNILEREPDNAEALNALGYTLANKTERYDEALRYIKRALELKPDDYFILDSMGWVQYRLGNYREAVKYLRRAMELSDDTEIAAHLGEVLWVMGEQEAARDVWDKALELAPNDKIILEVKRRLEP